MNKFTFESTQHTVEIAGAKYTIDFSDEKIAHYIKVSEQMKDRAAELNANPETAEDAAALIEEQKDMAAMVIEAFLGDGTFDALYNKAGRSIINLMSLIDYLNDLLSEQTTKRVEKANAKRSKYVKK